MTMRERFAEAVYLIKSNNCLVPFKDQGDLMREQCFQSADVLLDLLTVPPSEAMIYAANNWTEAVTITEVFERMVRAMIEEGKPKATPEWEAPNPCGINADCCLGDGHAGDCTDIPF